MTKLQSIARLLCATLALQFGCGDQAKPKRATSETKRASLRPLPAGTPVPMLELHRKERTAVQLAEHMLGVAETLSGTSLPASEAQSWAEDALRKGEFERHIAAPFSGFPYIRASYVQYFDELLVTNTALKRPGSDELLSFPANSPLQMGIGKDAASTIAAGILSSLESNGHIDAGPYALGGVRASRRTLADVEKKERYSTVSDYTPYYYRTVSDIPLLNTLVGVTVTRNGNVKGVRVQEIDAFSTGELRTLISDSDAFTLMGTQAESSVPAGMTVLETVLSDRQTGYFLPADALVASMAPLSKAKVVFKTPSHVTRARVAAISLDEQDPAFAFLPPASRTPRLRQDGEACTVDSDCKSENCFALIGTPGICGACDSDADCQLGCTPPGILSTPPKPSSCGEGQLGSGCETDGACKPGYTCADIAAIALGYTLRSCSECDSSNDCETGEVCGVSFSFSEQTAHRECAAPSTRGLGEICDQDGDCASARCSTFTFPEGTEIGVCGECNDASDCASPTSCTATEFLRDTGFSPSSCD
ncbi:MAG: hypothetical protein ACRBN8_46910 [Nannocystales bacterium]